MTKLRSFTNSKKIRIAVLSAVCVVIPLICCICYVLIPVKISDFTETAVCSAEILDRNDVLLRAVYPDNCISEEFVPSSEISEHMKNAVVAIEDKRFYSHCGIDFKSIARALALNVKSGRIVAGGSTLTQQLAKILLGNRKRTVCTKIYESLFALRLEHSLSKSEIVSLYLNYVSFGSSLIGIDAASECYFEKKPSQLSAAQSAFLAAIPLLPSYYDPYRAYDKVLDRSRLVLSVMRGENMLDENVYVDALNEKIVISQPSYTFNAPHFCDFVLSELKKKDIPIRGRIKTTLDLQLTREAEGILKANLLLLKDCNVTNGAVLVMDNKTGGILAMVGSENFYAEGGQVNACLTHRQSGSALKPFAYALAFENGMTAADVVPDIKMTVADKNGSFSPMNYDSKFHGPVRLRSALACSYNIPAARVLLNIGIEKFYSKLMDVGFENLDHPSDWYGVGLILGNAEVSLLELVRAYRLFASDGNMIDLKLLDNEPAGQERSLYSPLSSYIVYDILSDNSARAPAFGTSGYLRLPFKCAVKTGTTKNYRDNWCIGCTPEYTVGVWVGNFDSSSMKGISGVSGAGPIFNCIMRHLYEKELPDALPEPEGIVRKRICLLSGKCSQDFCPSSSEELFIDKTEPTELCDMHREIEIDVRTGFLPSSSSISKIYLKKKVFEILPPIYDDWRRERGIPDIPTELLSDFSADISSERAAVHTLAITFPTDGDSFRIDPNIDINCQNLTFRVAAERNIRDVVWTLNGVELSKASYPFTVEWNIKRGDYVLTASSGDFCHSVSFSVR